MMKQLSTTFFAVCLLMFLTTPLTFAQEADGGEPPARPLPNCTITFDNICPDVQPECGAKFRGGVGCTVDGQAFCYDSGIFAYRLDSGDGMNIRFRRDVTSLNVFFSHLGDSVQGGRMFFFDENGLQVDSFVTTSGDCSVSMPETQTLEFSTPIRRIFVKAIDTTVYLDTFEVNPSTE